MKGSFMGFVNKKICILGFGINNQKLFEWLIKHRVKDITICDVNEKLKTKNLKPQFKTKNLKYRLGKDYLKNLDEFDIVFRTPGIPILNPEIERAKSRGTIISSQTKLFFDLCPAKIIGVTGTKGKGTTSSLIFQILKRNFQIPNYKFQTNVKIQNPKLKTKVYLAGNIGKDPFEFLDKLTKNDWVVLELSSFQLQDLEKSPHIAVVLNITSDHLDYHKDTKEYIEAKTNIVRFQNKNDYAVINLDYLTSFRFAAISKNPNDYYFSRHKSVDLGTYIEWTPKGKGAHWGNIILRIPEKDYKITKTYNLNLRGEHNLENICAAVTASYLAGADIKIIKQVIENFKGLEHRIELFFEAQGVKYYDDSASTNPDTTIAAIKSFSEPIILIAGGSSKGANYTKLGREIVNSTVKTLITTGKTGPEIVKAIKQDNKITKSRIKIIDNRKDLQSAIKVAKKEAKSGDVVLLSPASASFDSFANYKERGKVFKKLVAGIDRH